MKTQDGFSLVELMVVVSIALLLLMWGIPAFSTWNKKHTIEGQMTQLYSNLQLARMTGYSRKILSGIYWGNTTSITSYQVNSNNNGLQGTGSGDTQIAPPVTVSSRCPNITMTASDGTTPTNLAFDGRGFGPTGKTITFSVADSQGAGLDCVAVSNTRIILGKMNGATCNPK